MWSNAVALGGGLFCAQLLNTLPRFAVPCFIMLSGAVNLSNEKNTNFRYFYKKIYYNIYVPTILFSVVYCVINVVYILINQGLTIGILSPIKSLLTGNPYYHLWYMFMMIWLYILSPFLILLKGEIGEKIFFRVSLLFLCMGIFQRYFVGSSGIEWDFYTSVRYLGYYMLGHSIMNGARHKHKLSYLAICVGFLIEVLIALFWNKSSSEILNYALVVPLSPGIVAVSILIFYGFSNLKIKRSYYQFASYTFYVYLLHALVLDLVKKFANSFLYTGNITINIILLTVFVFVLTSYLVISGKKCITFLNEIYKKKCIK